MTAARVMSRAGVSFGTSGILATSRSAKKRCRSARDSVGEHAVGEELALALSIRPRSPCVIAASMRVDGGERRPCAACGLGQRRARRLAGGDAGVAVGNLVCQVAHASRGAARRARSSRRYAIAPCSRSPSTTRSTIPSASARAAESGLPSVHISSASRGAAQPRQPLRAAGAGNDAEQHFRLADLGARHRDAVVAGHRELETAAERVAVNGRDQRLGRILERHQARVHGFRPLDRLLACLAAA